MKLKSQVVVLFVAVLVGLGCPLQVLAQGEDAPPREEHAASAPIAEKRTEIVEYGADDPEDSIEDMRSRGEYSSREVAQAQAEGEGGTLVHTVYESSRGTVWIPIDIEGLGRTRIQTQFVYPASELEDMVGSKIRSVRFFLAGLNQGSDDWTPAVFKVYLKEVDYERMYDPDDMSGVTKVYEGSLRPANMTLDIVFAEPFEYKGGNLFMCIENVTLADNKNMLGSFRGIERRRAAYSITMHSRLTMDYIPMTAFNHSPSHDHILHYLSRGDFIVAECEHEGCTLTGRMLRILPPQNLIYDGKAKAATIAPGYSKLAFPDEYKIAYTKNGQSVGAADVVGPGNYTASIDMQGQTASIEFAIHEHKYVYSANGDTVTATCEGAEGTCDHPMLSLSILPPSDLAHDGKAKAATLSEGYSKELFPDEYAITYSRDGKPIAAHDVVEPGIYEAFVTVAGMTISTEFSISDDFEGLYKHCVCDGTKVGENTVVYNNLSEKPVGSWSEFVYPKEMLGPLAGKTVGSLRFHVKDKAKAAFGGGNAVFSVHLKEVENASMGWQFEKLDGATMVYEGPLDATGEFMDIAFTNGYEYGGGNLMVSIRHLGKNDLENTASWYGVEQEWGNVRGSLYSEGKWWTSPRESFLPELTFGYAYPHEHSLTYSASGDTITATCAYDKCALTGNQYTLMPPSNLVCDGKAKEAAPKNGCNKVAFGDVRISYTMGGRPVEPSEVVVPGSYTASATIGGATVSVSFDLVPATLTVANGKDVSWQVPVWGVSLDRYVKSQFVIPASMLKKMENSNMSHMRFYVARMDGDSYPWSDAVFRVCLKEVDSDTISSFYDLSDSTVVYEGPLTPGKEYLDVPFAEYGYHYDGKNLLVSIHNVQTGIASNVEFYGVNREGASVGNRASTPDAISATQRNFLPKVTFTFVPDEKESQGGGAAGEPEDYQEPQKTNDNAGSSNATAVTKPGATSAGSMTNVAATTASRNATSTAKTADASLSGENAAILSLLSVAVLVGARKVRRM